MLVRAAHRLVEGELRPGRRPEVTAVTTESAHGDWSYMGWEGGGRGMEWSFWPHAGIIRSKPGPAVASIDGAHPLQAKVDLCRPAQEMIDIAPQPADMRQSIA